MDTGWMKHQIKTTELFDISTDQLIIGNYKYGKISNAGQKSLFCGRDSLFTITIDRKSDFEISIESDKIDRLSFYNFFGRFGNHSVSYERNFSIGENAILNINSILDDNISIQYTERFRNWTLSRFSKMKTIGNYLTDITTLRLLKDRILSFHGAAFEYGNKGYIITAFPDTGKSYTMLRLLEDEKQVNFMAEDIMMLDENDNIISVPFTQTIEKRKRLDTLSGMKQRLYNYFYKDNYIKSDVFEAINLPDSRFLSKHKLHSIFFLKRGVSNVRRLENKTENFRLLRDLNNLEFSYWRNELILTYLFFQENCSIYDFMEIENSMIKNISDNFELIEVTAESYDGYYPLIRNWLEGES